MDKSTYIHEIVKLLERCNDVELLDLIYQIMLKASTGI
nr:MAG TPA: hypothetical protein [Caudoviricetes sp.]